MSAAKGLCVFFKIIALQFLSTRHCRRLGYSPNSAVSGLVCELVVVDLNDAKRSLDVFHRELRIEVAGGGHGLVEWPEELLLAVLPVRGVCQTPYNYNL